MKYAACFLPDDLFGTAKWYAPRTMPALREPLYCCVKWGLRYVWDSVAFTYTKRAPLLLAFCQLTFFWCDETSWPLGLPAAETGISARAVPLRASVATEAAMTRARRRDGL